MPGITRRRRGKGFSYTHPDGRPVTESDVLQRIKALAVPPAWVDVWICPWPNGHIQAVGTDAAGRRQYRYHDAWRARRDREKYARVEEFGRALPALRAKVRRDLASDGLQRERVVAAIVRLLDIGCFRVGGETYAEEHDTFGVASLRKDHVQVRHGLMCFCYPAKGSIERKLEVADDDVLEVVRALRRRRSGENLFAYKTGNSWANVTAQEVNDYIKAAAGEAFSAKDFRTWSGTVLAASALAGKAEEAPGRPRRRAVAEAVSEVAARLGNTPTVCRSSYVDPRVIEHFEEGDTIGRALSDVPELADPADPSGAGAGKRRRRVERAVIGLLEDEGAEGAA